jgi:two-component system phosphate regulon response regulator OmpR
MSERHLLVVDDDDRIRGLLKEYLSRAGFRVTGAQDAASARRMLNVLDFDLMILDVMMPGEDGLALTRSIRAEGGPKAHTPILMLTARGLAEDRIGGLTSGVDDYLPKPSRLSCAAPAGARAASPNACRWAAAPWTSAAANYSATTRRCV